MYSPGNKFIPALAYIIAATKLFTCKIIRHGNLSKLFRQTFPSHWSSCLCADVNIDRIHSRSWNSFTFISTIYIGVETASSVSLSLQHNSLTTHFLLPAVCVHDLLWSSVGVAICKWAVQPMKWWTRPTKFLTSNKYLSDIIYCLFCSFTPHLNASYLPMVTKLILSHARSCGQRCPWIQT